MDSHPNVFVVLSIIITSLSLACSQHCRVTKELKCCCRSVYDPRDNVQKALKKMSHVFQSLVSCKRVIRELKMLTSFEHDNVSGLLYLRHLPYTLIYNDQYCVPWSSLYTFIFPWCKLC